MRTLITYFSFALLNILVTANASPVEQGNAASVGQTCWQGRLLIKGNAPYTEAILQTSEGMWRLQGLDQSAFEQHQRKQVGVVATVIPKSGDSETEPALEVTRIQESCNPS